MGYEMVRPDFWDRGRPTGVTALGLLLVLWALTNRRSGIVGLFICSTDEASQETGIEPVVIESQTAVLAESGLLFKEDGTWWVPQKLSEVRSHAQVLGAEAQLDRVPKCDLKACAKRALRSVVRRIAAKAQGTLPRPSPDIVPDPTVPDRTKHNPLPPEQDRSRGGRGKTRTI